MCSPWPLLAHCGFYATFCNVPSLLTAVQSLLLPRARDVHPWMLAWKIPAPYKRESRSCCSQGRQSRVSSVPCLAPLSPLHHMDSLSVMCSTAPRHKPTPGMFLLSKYSQDDGSCLESKPNIRAPEPLKLSRTLEGQQQLPGEVWGIFPAVSLRVLCPGGSRGAGTLSGALLVGTARSSRGSLSSTSCIWES